jgi:AcrR family transcriptional regulator
MEKKAAILKVAEKLFTSRPFHEVTVEDVAKAAKVGKGTIYKYFADKDELFFNVVTSGPDELCELLHKQVPGEASFESQLTDMCGAISEFFRSRHKLFRLMQSQEAGGQLFKRNMRGRHMENRRKMMNVVAEVLKHGVRNGLIRDDIQAPVLADALIALMWSRSHLQEDEPGEVPPLEVVLDLFMSGAGARKAAALGSAGGTT